MTHKSSIFLAIECNTCNETISYVKVEEGDSMQSISLWPMTDQYCPKCYEKQKTETEKLT